MIVTCESCHTKFNLDPSRLKGSRSKVRCSRCGHVFALSLPEDDEQELLPRFDSSDEPEVDDEGLPFSQPLPVSPAPPTLPAKKRRSILKPVLLVLIALLALGGVLFALLGRNETPSEVSSVVSGKGSAVEVTQPTITLMDTTQGFFLENPHSGQIFVVEGEVKNESPKPVSFVLVEGRLYTRSNQVAQSQRCFCGNVMNRTELTQLGIAEIQNRMMNREGKDLLNVHVPPGKRLPFMLVFQNLPELDALGDYSVEVISAQVD